MKVSELNLSQLAKIYVQLRDRRAQRKALYDAEDAADKEKQEKIEGILLQRFEEQGVESVRTENGTPYKYVRESCSTADADAFWSYVMSNEAFELIEKRPNKTTVRQFIDEKGDVPPGLNWRQELCIGVRRS